MIKDERGRLCVWATVEKDGKDYSVLVPVKYIGQYYNFSATTKRKEGQKNISFEDYSNWIEFINVKYPKANFDDWVGGAKKRNSLLAGITVVGLLLFMLITNVISKSNSSNQNNEIVRNSPYDGSVSQVEDYLEKTLKDPDSYQSIEWSEVKRSSSTGAKYFVRH